jgi:hypothetical protein
MGLEVLVWTEPDNPNSEPQPGTDEEAMKGWGEAGKVLMTYATVEKLRSTIESLQEKLDSEGRYHPELRVPGTQTGRLSGSGGFNWQNVAKRKEYLEIFRAPEGKVLMFADIAALEPATLAQRSQDPTYLMVYGPDAKPTDIYLQVAANLGGELGAKIRATGFDPKNPTAEAVSKAKKEAKKERNIAKLLHLSCIAEGTLVRVKSQGWKPIEQVKPGEFVWDGQEWVEQSGAVLKGTKQCVNFRGTAMTADHEVLTHDGWQISERANPAQCVKPRDAGATWADVWAMAGYVARSLAAGRKTLD